MEVSGGSRPFLGGGQEGCWIATKTPFQPSPVPRRKSVGRPQQHKRFWPPGLSEVDSILGMRSAGLRPQCPIIVVPIRPTEKAVGPPAGVDRLLCPLTRRLGFCPES